MILSSAESFAHFVEVANSVRASSPLRDTELAPEPVPFHCTKPLAPNGFKFGPSFGLSIPSASRDQDAAAALAAFTEFSAASHFSSSSNTSPSKRRNVQADTDGSYDGDEAFHDTAGGTLIKRRRLSADERQIRSRERNRMHAKKVCS